MNIELIIEALDHATTKQRDRVCQLFDDGLSSWAGIELGEIIAEYSESIEPDLSEPTEAQEQAEWNHDNPRSAY